MSKQQSASPDTSSVLGKKKKPIRARAREKGNTLRSFMIVSEHEDSASPTDTEKNESSSSAPYRPRAPSKGNRTSINHYQTEQSQTESSNY